MTLLPTTIQTHQSTSCGETHFTTESTLPNKHKGKSQFNLTLTIMAAQPTKRNETNSRCSRTVWWRWRWRLSGLGWSRTCLIRNWAPESSVMTRSSRLRSRGSLIGSKQLSLGRDLLNWPQLISKSFSRTSVKSRNSLTGMRWGLLAYSLWALLKICRLVRSKIAIKHSTQPQWKQGFTTRLCRQPLQNCQKSKSL